MREYVEVQQRIIAEHQKNQETEARDQRALEKEKIKEKQADQALEEGKIKLEGKRLKIERERLKNHEAIEMEKLKSNEKLELEKFMVKRGELNRVPRETATFEKVKLQHSMNRKIASTLTYLDLRIQQR